MASWPTKLRDSGPANGVDRPHHAVVGAHARERALSSASVHSSGSSGARALDRRMVESHCRRLASSWTAGPTLPAASESAPLVPTNACGGRAAGRERDAVALQFGLDAEIEVAHERELVLGSRVQTSSSKSRELPQSAQLHLRPRIALHRRMCPRSAEQRVAHDRDIRAVGDADRHVDARERIAVAPVHDLALQEARVGHQDRDPVERADLRRAGADASTVP